MIYYFIMLLYNLRLYSAADLGYGWPREVSLYHAELLQVSTRADLSL